MPADIYDDNNNIYFKQNTIFGTLFYHIPFTKKMLCTIINYNNQYGNNKVLFTTKILGGPVGHFTKLVEP